MRRYVQIHRRFMLRNPLGPAHADDDIAVVEEVKDTETDHNSNMIVDDEN